MADYSRTHREVSTFLKSETQFFAIEITASAFEKKAWSYERKSFENILIVEKMLNRYDLILFKGFLHFSMSVKEHWSLIHDTDKVLRNYIIQCFRFGLLFEECRKTLDPRIESI